MIERLGMALAKPLLAVLADDWLKGCSRRLLELNPQGMAREEAEDLACDLYLSPAGYREMTPEAAAERAYAWRQSLGALGRQR